MPVSADIYNALGARPKSMADYQTEFNTLDQQRNALQQSNMQLQQSKALMDQRNALRSAVQGGQIDLSNPAHQGSALALAPDVAPGLLKTIQEGQTSAAVAKKDTAQADTAQFDLRLKKANQAIADISALTDPQSALASLDKHLASGDIDAQKYAAVKATIPQDPAQFPAWRKQMLVNILDAKTQLELSKPTIQTRNTGGTTDVLAIDPMTGQAKVTNSVRNTVSPDASLQASTSRANNKANIAKDYTVAGLKPDGTPAEGGGLLNQQSIINAATRYNIDGTLPPNLGRGTQGVRQTSEILNEAARQAAERGDTPEAQRIAQIANKASSAALGKLQTQQTMLGAFEKNFNKNADIALELSQKVDRTGVPILNKWINAGKRSVAGDPDIAAFDANIKATVNEYAKIVGGGTGSSATAQGEIAKIEGLLSAAQTKEQVASVIGLMKRETANRMSSFEDEKAQLRDSMVKPRAQAATTATAPSLPAGWKIEKVK